MGLLSGRDLWAQNPYADLSRHDQLVFVQFSPTASRAEIDSFMYLNGLMRDIPEWDHHDLFRTNRSSAAALIPSLTQSAMIHFANPVFMRPESSDPPYISYGDRIIVKFRDGVSEAEIDALNSRLETVKVRQIEGGDWTLKVLYPKSRDVIMTTELYRQEAIVRSASVDTYIFHGARATPNDSLFSSQWNLHQASDVDIDAPEA